MKLMKVRKPKYVAYMLKTTNMKIKFINVIVFLVFALHNGRMGVASSSVSQQCTATTFRVTDLIQIDVELIFRKKMCRLHKAV